ncbi:MAG: hypothetical protein AAGA73_15280 [Pseudomonadota bacterium]
MSAYSDHQQANILLTAQNITKRLGPIHHGNRMTDEDLKNGLIEELMAHENRSVETSIGPFLAVAAGLGGVIIGLAIGSFV